MPIPALYDVQTGEAELSPSSITRIIEVLKEKGMDHWWTGPVEDFLCPELKSTSRAFYKGTDTMDVWFDSGSSWASLKDRLLPSKAVRTPLADVYLEGSDQHRGWFQSSLLTSIAVSGSSPYSTVITHGFVLDEKGVKMSKSVGNVISPLTVINGGKDKAKEPALGADALRFWAASAGYTKEVNISIGILQNASEGLRKIRNTVRFILGNLAHSQDQHEQRPQLSMIDRYVLHELSLLAESAETAYDEYAFNRAMSDLSQFCASTLSSFYFEIIKDSLYADSMASERRKGTVYTLQQVSLQF